MDNQVNKAIDLLISEEDDLFSNPLVFDDKWLDARVDGTWTRRADGKIDVEGDVNMNRILKGWSTTIPFQFGKVTGDFNCGGNHITSLEGSPEYVGGDYDVHQSRLTSLEGSPEYVGGNYDIEYSIVRAIRKNYMTDMKGLPKTIKGKFRSTMWWPSMAWEYQRKTYEGQDE